MARKDLLKGLMAEDPGPAGRLSPRPNKGAIGAVSQSIAELKGRALIDVPADLIDQAGLPDRLEEDPEDFARLLHSIGTYGQQVPVLLRHSPNVEGRYDIVYGRRRVAALKRLGRPVRAMVRELPTRDLIVAQGQENTARRDLSFIEKAAFAGRMQAQGFARAVICDALHIDKTVLSRMLSVIEALPEGVVEAIGAAPSAGRERWMALAQRIKGRPARDVIPLARGETSDARFRTVFEGLGSGRPSPSPAPLRGAGGAVLGAARATARGATLTLSDPDFSAWLIENMEDIHRRFLAP
jgi:ParB family transcriptional regulator, chromosome partitioning protein